MSDLDAACRQLVAFKDHLDAMLKHGDRAGLTLPLAGQLIAGVRPHGRSLYNVAATNPYTFTRLALPFVDRVHYRNEYVQDQLDPRHILAGTYNHYDPHAMFGAGNISPDHVMDRSDSLVLNSDGDAHGHPEMPRVGKIGDLPLYYSIEGKNRVSLFKQFRTRMHVFVKQCSFPQPDELRLVHLSPFGQVGLEGFGELHVLPFPPIVMDVLQGYGVQFSKRQMLFGAWREARIRRQTIANSQMVS